MKEGSIMIGLRFTSYSSIKEILKHIIDEPFYSNKVWCKSRYYSLNGNKDYFIRFLLPEKMKSVIFTMPDSEICDNCCFFLLESIPEKNQIFPATMQDYLVSDYLSAFICTDSNEYDIYIKNTDAIIDLRKTLLSQGLCVPEKIEYIMTETDDRYGFGI